MTELTQTAIDRGTNVAVDAEPGFSVDVWVVRYVLAVVGWVVAAFAGVVVVPGGMGQLLFGLCLSMVLVTTLVALLAVGYLGYRRVRRSVGSFA